MKTLKVLAVNDPAVKGYVKEEFEIIKRYEQSNNIKIDFDIVDWEYYYNTLLKSFLTYQYDVVMVAGHLWLPDFASKGYIKELNIPQEQTYDYEDILPIIRDELTMHDALYALPSFCDGHMLCYRNDQISFDTNNPISIKEILSIVNIGETCLKAHPSELFLDMLPYLRAYGIEPYNQEGKPDFDENQMIKALRHYKNMVQLSLPNTLQFGNQEVLENIQQNNVKCAVSWGGQIGQILNEDCTDKETLSFIGLKESWNVTWSFAIPSLTKKHKEALDFIKYLSSKEVDRIIGRFSGNPTRLSTFKKDAEKCPWYRQLLDMISHAELLPKLTQTGELIGIYTTAFNKYLLNELNELETIEEIKQKLA